MNCFGLSKDAFASARKGRELMVKTYLRELEDFHLKRKDQFRPSASFNYVGSMVAAWEGIHFAIVNDTSGEEAMGFFQRQGLNWVYWYVVQEPLADNFLELKNVLQKIMAVMVHMVNIGRRTGIHNFKKRHAECCQDIMEKLMQAN